MSSPGSGVTDAKIILFCLKGSWEKTKEELKYTPVGRTENEIDRFVRKNKLITTDVETQLKKHLHKLVEDQWLIVKDNFYQYIQVDLLGISSLLLFVATYDPNDLDQLMSNIVFKNCWYVFRDSLFYNIHPFRTEFSSEPDRIQTSLIALKPPPGSNNIDSIVNNSDRKRTVKETIRTLKHEKSNFKYYFLRDPFKDVGVSDLLSRIALEHRIESIGPYTREPIFADRSVKAKMKRVAWNLKLNRFGVKLKPNLDLWKIEGGNYSEWENPILSVLEKKFLSNKRFALFVSTLVLSGASFSHSIYERNATPELSVGFKAIATELLLLNPISLLPLLERINGLEEKSLEEIHLVNDLGHRLVRPDPSKTVWQPVFALPYGSKSSLPTGHSYGHPMMALAILIHGALECDENLLILDDIIGHEARRAIEQNGFPHEELIDKVIEYYFSLRHFTLCCEIDPVLQEMKDRLERTKELNRKLELAMKTQIYGKTDGLIEEILGELKRLQSLNEYEVAWSREPKLE